jgi:hypothetical protein
MMEDGILGSGPLYALIATTVGRKLESNPDDYRLMIGVLVHPPASHADSRRLSTVHIPASYTSKSVSEHLSSDRKLRS